MDQVRCGATNAILTPLLPSLDWASDSGHYGRWTRKRRFTRSVFTVRNIAWSGPGPARWLVNCIRVFVYGTVVRSASPGRSTGRRDILCSIQVIDDCERTVTANGAADDRHRMAEYFAIACETMRTTDSPSKTNRRFRRGKPRAKIGPAMIPAKDMPDPFRSTCVDA